MIQIRHHRRHDLLATRRTTMLARQIIGTTVLTPRHAHRAWFSASTAASTQANRHQNNDSSTSESDPSAEISPWRIGDRPGQRYTGATHRQLSESNPATRYLDRLDHRLEPRPLLLPVPFWSAYSWRNVRRWKTQMDVRIDVLTSTKKRYGQFVVVVVFMCVVVAWMCLLSLFTHYIMRLHHNMTM